MVLSTNKESEVLFSDTNKYSLLEEIRDIIERNINKKISLIDLVEKINESEKNFESAKPISPKDILSEIKYKSEFILNKNLTSFDNIPKNITIKLSTSNVYDIRKLIKESLNYEDFLKIKKNKNGVYAVIYKGDSFPLKVAQEYVKLRPIVYVGISKDVFGEVNKIFNSRSVLTNQLLMLVASIHISNGIEIGYTSKSIKGFAQEWIKKYITFNYVPCNNKESKTVYKSILKDITPILNTDNDYNIYNVVIEQNIEFFKMFYNSDKGNRSGGRI